MNHKVDRITDLSRSMEERRQSLSKNRNICENKLLLIYIIFGYVIFSVVLFIFLDRFIENNNLMIYFTVIGIITVLLAAFGIRLISKLQKELKEKEELYNIAINSTTDGIWRWEIAENKWTLSPRWGEMLGFSAEEFPSCYEAWSELVHPDDIEGIKKIHQDLLSRKIPEYQTEYRLRRKNGEYIWVLTRGKAIFDKNYKPIKMIGSHTDITEYKRIEEELRESEERYKGAISGSKDGIWEWNVQTNEVFFSPRWKEMLGYSENEIPKYFDLWSRLVHPEDIGRVRKAHEDHMNKLTPVYQIEYRIKTQNGDYKWVLSRAQGVWDKVGNPIKMAGSHTDITERKEMEEMLLKSYEENKRLLSQEIEYSKLKTEFFANISHELRTPLNVMLSTLQLLDLYHKEGKTDKINEKKYINIISQNCFRLLRLINNIIDITRLDSGYFQSNMHNYNIIDIVERITKSVVEFAKNKSLTLKFNSDIKKKIIACDIDKIERIMLNLLSNAIKFTKPGGKIYVNMNCNDNNVIIAVKDTGVGITEDKQKIIFERFRQGDSLLTRDYEGSGIGLSLVKSLVEVHGGKISLVSEFGKGSQFIVELPAKVLDEDEIVWKKGKGEQSYLEITNVELSDIYSYN